MRASFIYTFLQLALIHNCPVRLQPKHVAKVLPLRRVALQKQNKGNAGLQHHEVVKAQEGDVPRRVGNHDFVIPEGFGLLAQVEAVCG